MFALFDWISFDAEVQIRVFKIWLPHDGEEKLIAFEVLIKLTSTSLTNDSENVLKKYTKLIAVLNIIKMLNTENGCQS